MKSLHLRIMLIFSLLILLSTSIMGYTVYTSSVRLITQSIGEQAYSIAQYAVEQIDREQYRDIAPELGETPYYTELRQRLNELREAHHLKYLYTMNRSTVAGEERYYYVVDGMPLDATGQEVSELGTLEEEDIPLLEQAFAQRKAQVGELTSDERYGAVVSAYVPIIAASGELLGVLGADFDGANVYALLEKNRRNMLLIAAVILSVSLAIIYLLSRQLVSPLLRLARSMHTIEQGDLTPAIEVRGKDEISRLAAAFRAMVQMLRAMIQAIHHSSAQLRQSSASLAISAGTTHTASEQINRYLQETAANAETQAQYTGETARAIGEVSSGVERVSGTLNFVAGLSREAARASHDGNLLVRQAVERMEQIEAMSQNMSREITQLALRSGQVSEMISVIRDISTQTNLLALNASIEAARAGEHGRGFTVVAGQVRKLAEQAKESAERISGIVAGMAADMERVVTGVRAEGKQIGEGLAAVHAAGQAFAQIWAASEQVADEIQGISAVSEEISASIEEIAASADEMGELSRHNSDHLGGIANAAQQQLGTVEQLKQAAAKVESMSGELERMAGKFRME